MGLALVLHQICVEIGVNKTRTLFLGISLTQLIFSRHYFIVSPYHKCGILMFACFTELVFTCNIISSGLWDPRIRFQPRTIASGGRACTKRSYSAPVAQTSVVNGARARTSVALLTTPAAWVRVTTATSLIFLQEACWAFRKGMHATKET